MGLNGRSTLDPRWRANARIPLLGFCACTIQIIQPNTTQLGLDFDPWTNTAATDPSDVIYTGLAQAEYYRQPRTATEPDNGVTFARSVRFTLADDGPDADIVAGMWINITECTNQPDLMHYQFVVESGLTLPLGFMRTIETVVNLKNVGV